jgi:hypothetical protein
LLDKPPDKVQDEPKSLDMYICEYDGPQLAPELTVMYWPLSDILILFHPVGGDNNEDGVHDLPPLFDRYMG